MLPLATALALGCAQAPAANPPDTQQAAAATTTAGSYELLARGDRGGNKGKANKPNTGGGKRHDRDRRRDGGGGGGGRHDRDRDRDHGRHDGRGRRGWDDYYGYGYGAGYWGSGYWWNNYYANPWWGLSTRPYWFGNVALTTTQLVNVGSYYFPFYSVSGSYYPDYSRPYMWSNGAFVRFNDPLNEIPNQGGAISALQARVYTVPAGTVIE